VDKFIYAYHLFTKKYGQNLMDYTQIIRDSLPCFANHCPFRGHDYILARRACFGYVGGDTLDNYAD